MNKIINKIYSLFCDLDNRSQNMSNKTRIYIIGMCFIGLFLIILKLNIMTPLWIDDYSCSLVFGSKDRHLESFRDVYVSQYYFYFNWSGRTVLHLISQLLLMCSPIIADLINSFVFSCFILVIYIHIKGKNKNHDIELFLLIFIFTWFLQPAFGETILWLTGSANYLWGTFIILVYLLPYRFYENKNCKFSLLKTILMFLCGIIAGWTNENMSIALIMMLTYCIFYWKRQSFKIPSWAILGFVGVVFGCIIMLAAPGNYLRSETTNFNHSLFSFYYKFNVFTARFFYNLGYVIIITLILLVIVIKFSNISRSKLFKNILFYSIGCLAATYSMLFSPSFPARVWFGIITMGIIIFGLSYYNLNKDLRFIRYIRYSILSVSILSFIFSFYISYKDIKMANIQSQERELLIKKAILDNKSSVQIYPIPSNSKFVIGDVPLASSVMSRYYKIEVLME